MKILCVLLFFLLPQLLWAAQKAKIVGEVVEIYSAADFDSDIIDEVHAGESYLISNQATGAFYKIRLKSGKIGFIVDYQLNIAGKGQMQPQDLDELFLADMNRRLKNSPESKSAEQREQDEEEEQVFGRTYGGPILELINYHEDTLGATQTDDLVAVGYKSVSSFTWSAVASFNAPKYYAEKTGGSAKGVKVWGDIGFSSTMGYIQTNELRFGGTIFTHISLLQVDTPARKYDLHDATLGLALEGALLVKFKKNALDISIKYYFDKSSYAGFGIAYLF